MLKKHKGKWKLKYLKQCKSGAYGKNMKILGKNMSSRHKTQLIGVNLKRKAINQDFYTYKHAMMYCLCFIFFLI